MELSEEQQEIFDYYCEGTNIFMTGPGGCGKSFLIKYIYDHATKLGKRIKVCAMTGCAAILLECSAKTLHSWAGIGLAKGDHNKIITHIAMNKYKSKMWKTTDVLIVDEVSMMSKSLFDLLDQLGKRIRKNAKPFGGIQLIFSGDFYQLPPVGNIHDPDSSAFCFESPNWNNTFDYQIPMETIFRQTNNAYVSILNQIREGKLLQDGYNALKQRVGVTCSSTIIKPIKLYPRRQHVEIINNGEMNKLTGERQTFIYNTKYEPSSTIMSQHNYKIPSKKQLETDETYIINNSSFEKKLSLVVGCQVMCIANLDTNIGIVNGSTGVVRQFIGGVPEVQFKNGITIPITPHSWKSENIPGFEITQIPLILAYAITIHKSQGATLDCAEIDIGGGIFADGQTYVAISRVKTIDNLYLTAFNPQKIRSSTKVRKFYSQFYEEVYEE